MDAVAPIPQSTGQATLGEVIMPRLGGKWSRLASRARSRNRFGSWSMCSGFLHIMWSLIEIDCCLLPSSLAVRGLVERRVGREPLQYILGTQEFCGLEFHVNPAVLIPRPETELLVEYVAQRISADRQATIVDVGTGPGALPWRLRG